MKDFIVHMLHHYGWTTDTVQAATAEAAKIAVVQQYHPFLEREHQNDYTISFVTYENGCEVYRVHWAGEDPKLMGLGHTMADGELWFSNRIHIGHPDDCSKCGGTGLNRYNTFKPCWKCDGSKKKDMTHD